jgi:uncharacterized membrane protein
LLELLLPRGFGCSFFEWLLLCVICWFKILLVFIVLTFTLKVAFSRHAKSVHPPISLVSQASQVVLLLQVSFPLVLILGFNPLAF